MPRLRKPKPQQARFVVDSSIVAAWYFADETDTYADAVAVSLPISVAIVPSLFHLEIANILISGERRKRSSEAQAAAFLKRLAGLPITVDAQTTTRAWSDTIAIARAHGLTSYNAAYLELAIRESLPLASLDRALKAAAKAIGVPPFAP